MGVLCEAKAVNDTKNIFPYILYLTPTEKARLTSTGSEDEKVASLCRVIVERIHEKNLYENDLSIND